MLFHQARALAAQLAETEKIRFVIGTQSLKQVNNQVHLIEFNEEDSTLKTTVCIMFSNILLTFVHNYFSDILSYRG